MPGNEVGDRVHNFFAEDNLSQDQSVFSNDQWVGGQRRMGVQGFNPKHYNLQQSDNERGSHNSYFHVPNGLNFSESNLRPEFPSSQSQSQQSNLNGSRFYNPRRQDEANFLGMDSGSDHQNMASGDLSLYDSSQGSGSKHQSKTLIRSEASESPVSFDFFGTNQQMNQPQPGMFPSLLRQQSGFSDMQLQQQIILRKMQEIQGQQQFLQQLDTGQENSVTQLSPFPKQGSNAQSSLLPNGTPTTGSFNYSSIPEHAVGNIDWWQRGSATMIGSPTRGPISSPNQSQALLMGMVPQQMNQSLYGVPVSSSRGNLNQYSHVAAEKSPVPPMPTFRNSFSGNQLSAQLSIQNGSSILRPGFQEDKSYGPSGQVLGRGMNAESLQQMNAMQRNESFQDFCVRKEGDGPPQTIQENRTLGTIASQNSVALDPTEEKILFGSDDNIWDAFGGNSNSNGAAGNLCGTGFANGLPSIQSGSWSALMQSAVAETSGSDFGPQEEWSGLNVQNADVPSRNQSPSVYDNSGKYQISIPNDSNQTATRLDTGSAPLIGDANMNYNNVLGFQQFGHKISHGPETNLSQSHVQQSAEGGGIWLHQALLQKSLSDGNQAHGKAFHTIDSDANVKSISSPRTPRHVGSSNLGDKPIGWNIIESVPHSGAASSVVQGSGGSLTNNLRRTMHGETSHDGHLWKNDSIPDSNVELVHANASFGGLHDNREGFSSSYSNLIPNSNSTRVDDETSESLRNNQQFSNWKNVDSLVESKGIEGAGKHNHPKIGSQDVESLNNYGLEEIKVRVKESCSLKENSNESYHSNLSNSPSAGGLRENQIVDANDLRSLPGGKQKASSKVGRKNSGRKFQYHPMGNVDEDDDPSHGMKQTHLQAMSHQNVQGFNIHDMGHSVRSKIFKQVPNSSTEGEKTQSSFLHGQTKDSGGSIQPGFIPNVAVPFKRPGVNAMGKTSQSRKHMLEGMDYPDQPRQSDGMGHMNSSQSNLLSKIPEIEDSDGGSACHLQKNQLSASRGFGLQLGPPSQGLPVPNQSLSMQSFVQAVNAFSSNHTPAVVREKGYAQLASTTFSPSFLPSTVTSQLDKNNGAGVQGQTNAEASQYRMPGSLSSAFSSGLSYSEFHHQSPSMAGPSGAGLINHSTNTSFPDRPSSHSKSMNDNPSSSGDLHKPSSNSHPGERVSASQVSVVETVPKALSKYDVTQQNVFPNALPNMWISGPEQHSPHVQAQNSSNIPPSHQSNLMESTSSGFQGPGLRVNFSSAFGARTLDLQNLGGGEQMIVGGPCSQVSSGNINVGQKSNESQMYSVRDSSDSSAANTVSAEKDMAAFGRSLKPNNPLQQNYSLLNQMKAMKNLVSDLGSMGLKRLEGSDGLAGQQLDALAGQSSEDNHLVGDAFIHRISGPSGDSKMLSSLSPAENLEIGSSQLVKVSCLNSSQCDVIASARVEQSQISPQMAPSWFNQYGTFKNGQMLSGFDARKGSVMIPSERPFTLGNLSSSVHTLNSKNQLNAVADASEFGKVNTSSTPETVTDAGFDSSKSLPPDVRNHAVEDQRPKKRKSAIFEIHPWHKESSSGSEILQSMSLIQVEWATATNRLAEKVDDDIEMIQDGHNLLRRKRRLVLTTQLMQQLFCPPPRAIFSADAVSHYESFAYCVTRRTLGDTCCRICSPASDSIVPSDAPNFPLDKLKTSETIDDHHMSKVVEDLLERAKKIEMDLSRLDKRVSFLDLKVEYQDLEKFSVINRFARFHGRTQADGADVSSESAASFHKPIPQRYVTALPMPRTLPDAVQCLSL